MSQPPRGSLQVLIVALGSHGDVLPMLAMGQELRRRGHEVVVATAEPFGPLVERAGLAVHRLGETADVEAVLADPALWRPVRGIGTLFAAATRATRPVYDFIDERRRRRPRSTVVVASALAFGARVAQEQTDLPLVTVQLAPILMRTRAEVPRLPGYALLRLIPERWRAGIWPQVDRRLLDPLCLPGLNEARREIGLWPVGSGIGDWWTSPDGVLAMFPHWFAPPSPDWPPGTVQVGFPPVDRLGVEAGLGEDVSAFLAAGAPPIVFTAGTAMRHAGRFFAASVAICRRLGRRGILLSRDRAQVPEDLGSGCLWVEYAPMSLLLPGCAAIVHHGGVGTTAEAFRAGLPQLVVPLAFDQFDHAARVSALGVGRSLPRRAYPVLGRRALARLLASPEVAARCAAVARQARAGRDEVLPRAAAAIEGVFARHAARRGWTLTPAAPPA